jgi:repressor LexA
MERYATPLEAAEASTPTRLPLYIMGHIAGTTDAEAEQIDEIEVAPRQARLADSAFVIHGSSMAPYFLDGDVVGVKRQPTAQTGQLVVALADGDLTFKRYGGPVGGRGGLLLPLNPEHDPIVAEEIEVFGVYRWSMRESRDGRV